MKKETAIERINNLSQKTFNKSQKIIAIEIINSAKNEKQVSQFFSLIIQKIKVGLTFDEAIEIPNGEVSIINYNNNLSIGNGKNEHKFIIGENLEALKNIKITHSEKIDIIYIDPPYNTDSSKNDGNQLTDIEESTIEEKANKGLSTFVYRDKFSKTGWLNMMRERLILARDLLTNEGIIFVSIDDTENAYLKILMDEIFGYQNFMANIVVENTKTQGMKVSAAKEGGIVKNLEYVLMYSKNVINHPIKNIIYDPAEKKFDSHFTYFKEKDRLISIISWLETTNYNRDFFKLYDLNFNIKSIDILMKISSNFNKFIIENSPNIYRTMLAELPKIQSQNIPLNKVVEFEKYLLYRTKENQNIQQLLSMDKGINLTNDYYPEYQRSVIRGNLWKGFDKDSMNLGKEGNVKFKNGKKSLRLIKQLIKWIEKDEQITVLDFFAGSGTTAHAIMEMNAEDNGNRKAIIVSNNQNNIAYNTTLQRLNNVVNGSNKNEGLSINKIDVFELKHYKVDFTSTIDDLPDIVLKNFKKFDKNFISTEEKIYYSLSALRGNTKNEAN